MYRVIDATAEGETVYLASQPWNPVAWTTSIEEAHEFATEDEAQHAADSAGSCCGGSIPPVVVKIISPA